MFTLKWEILIILKKISQLRPRVGDFYLVEALRKENITFMENNVQRPSKPNY